MLAKDAYMDESKQNWDKRSHAIMWKYQTTWNISTGYSTFWMMYEIGSKLSKQFDLTIFMTIEQKLKKTNEVKAVKSHQQQLMEVNEAQAMAMVQLKQAQQLHNKYHDNRIRTHNLKPFKKVDSLIISDAIRFKRARKKFLLYYFRPFIV